MPRLTAIEISSDTCVLVRTSVSGTSVDVGGVQVIDPAAFPGGGTFAATIRHARRAGRFPRRARVVLWGMPDGASPSDPSVSPQLEPLVSAGFRIDRAVTPCNALSALARVRRPKTDNAVIWLAVDRAGVALIAMRTGELMYSHAFDWDSSIGATGSQAHLLRRYALVSYLAPEIRRAMAAVEEKGRIVDAIVTCGTLTDLRSLTMPLIDELDLEVETLDSIDGLTATSFSEERLSEMAAALRIACAGAIARPTRLKGRAPIVAKQSSALRVAALALIGILVAVAAYFVVMRMLKPRTETPRVSIGSAIPEPVAPKSAPPPAPTPPPPAATIDPATPASTAGRGAPLLPPAPRADKPRAEPPREPLPFVNTIMVSATRRFATVDEEIVEIGDKVGKRVIVGIEPHYVVFREPSGALVRVGLGGRRYVGDRVPR
jgi:hypothetical protein